MRKAVLCFSLTSPVARIRVKKPLAEAVNVPIAVQLGNDVVQRMSCDQLIHRHPLLCVDRRSQIGNRVGAACHRDNSREQGASETVVGVVAHLQSKRGTQ